MSDMNNTQDWLKEQDMDMLGVLLGVAYGNRFIWEQNMPKCKFWNRRRARFSQVHIDIYDVEIALIEEEIESRRAGELK